MCKMVLFGFRQKGNFDDEKVFEITQIKAKEEMAIDGYENYSLFCDGYGCCCSSIVGVLAGQDEDMQRLFEQAIQKQQKERAEIEKRIEKLGDLWTEYKLASEPLAEENKKYANELDNCEENTPEYDEAMRKYLKSRKKLEKIEDKYPKCYETDIDLWGNGNMTQYLSNRQQNYADDYNEYLQKFKKFLELDNHFLLYQYWQNADSLPIMNKRTIKIDDLTLKDVLYLPENCVLKITN